ncbi:MAG: SGNH/GDSL hydrolase family protein [Lachnospiraceae bacterium]|nr:SGNH/GDSL hydrolase family protein [Lachnospiraceae bacterium]
MMLGVKKGNRVIRKRRSALAWMLAFMLFILAGCGGQGGNDGNAAGAENQEDTAAGASNQADTAAGAEKQADTAAIAENNANADGGTEEDSTTAAGERSDEKMVEGARREDAAEEGETAARKLSILGDSISTFDGWIPEGYACYFPMDGEVSDVEQTWWKMVLKDTEMELCVNGSSSGSTCIGDSLSADNIQYGCSECRIWDLIGNKGSFPDVIIVYMGTNDFMKAVPLGDNDGTKAVEEGMIETFSDAYCMILDKLIAYYPNAEILCCNLPPMGTWGPESGPTFVTFVNSLELTAEDYGKKIEVIAAAKGCKIIDLQNCGITIDNMKEYVTDGIHMNPEGMKLIRNAVEAAL